MTTTKQISTVLARVEQLKAKQAELEQQEREADAALTELLGSSVREAVENPRSRWAAYADRTVEDFYHAIVIGEPTASESPQASEICDF